MRRLAATLMLVTALAATARALEFPLDALDETVRWSSQPVRFPVAPREVSGTPPFVPDSAVEVASGRVTVAPGRAAAVWLQPLGMLQVVAPNARGRLRFLRATGEPARMTASAPPLPLGVAGAVQIEAEAQA
jgi:hypothetical protein